MGAKMKKIIEILEKNDFSITEYNNDYELETWTNGGVDMLIYIDKDDNFIKQFKEKHKNFDIGEEIDIYRKDQRYKDNFTISESLKDFKSYKKRLKKIIKELELMK